MAHSRLRRRAAIFLLALVGPVCPATAWETASSFGLSALYSDNIGLVPEDGEEAWVGVGSATLQVRERTANVDAYAIGMLEYRDYQTDLFDDEFVFYLDGSALWTLTPERYFWSFEDYFRQAATDVLASPTPSNRQDTNLFFTGPEGRWHLSRASNLIAGARYGHFWFEETELDSHRLVAYGRLQHAWRPRTQLSLNGEFMNTRYLADRFEDYDRGDGFVRIEHTLSRSTMDLDLGATVVRRDREDDLDGFLARFGWHFPVNSYSSLDLRLLSEYTDPGADMLAMSSRDGALADIDQQMIGDVYYNRHAELAYHWGGIRTSWRFVGVAREEDYETVARDRTYGEGNVRFAYEFGPTLRATLGGTYRRADYREEDLVVTDRHGYFGLHYQINSRLWTGLEFGNIDRESDDPTEEYSENTALLSLTYERSAFME